MEDDRAADDAGCPIGSVAEPSCDDTRRCQGLRRPSRRAQEGEGQALSGAIEKTIAPGMNLIDAFGRCNTKEVIEAIKTNIDSPKKANKNQK